MQTATDFRFNVFVHDLCPCLRKTCPAMFKIKTYDEVIPKLFESYDFSLNQLYDGLEYIGCEYEKIIEIYNHQIQQMYHGYLFILTLTALTFTLRSTGKMISGKKDLPRKTEKNRLLVWDSCLTQIRFPSA